MMREQARHGGAAAMVGTQDLSQKNPERNQRGIDSIQPAPNRGQCFGNNFLG
jgi:hypothetical protein